jgi:2-polyprenyl-3-methyl-5-hydroxy-6-metoxy-1,4-benzoquinol methylase
MTTLDAEFGYDTAEHDKYHFRILPPLLDMLGRCGQRRVFEVGCGNGSMANALSKLGFKVSGIDLSEQGIAKANAAYPHLDLRVGSVYDDLRSQYGTFPVVISLEVIEHLTDPFLFCDRLFKLVEPGGHAIVSTPYHGYVKNLALSLTDHWDVHLHTLNQPGWHIKFFSMKTLTAVIEGAGFKVEQVVRFGRPVPWLATGMIALARRPSACS